MDIIVAGERKTYPEGLTVKALIAREKVETPEYVTVALGDRFVKSEELETTVLRDGDTVEFLYFMGGGR